MNIAQNVYNTENSAIFNSITTAVKNGINVVKSQIIKVATTIFNFIKQIPLTIMAHPFKASIIAILATGGVVGIITLVSFAVNYFKTITEEKNAAAEAKKLEILQAQKSAEKNRRDQIKDYENGVKFGEDYIDRAKRLLESEENTASLAKEELEILKQERELQIEKNKENRENAHQLKEFLAEASLNDEADKLQEAAQKFKTKTLEIQNIEKIISEFDEKLSLAQEKVKKANESVENARLDLDTESKKLERLQAKLDSLTT